MASKQWVFTSLAATGVGLITLSACLTFSPLDPSGQSFMNAPATDVRCLDESTAVILAYWEGNLAGLESLHSFWSCSSKAVGVFQSRVRGAVPGEYSADEVRTLVTKFFLKNAVISDRLLAETMRVKAAFLGGPTNKVTSGEIRKVLDWISLFREQSVKVYPYVGHFLGRVYLTDESVTQAAAAVMELAERMGEELGRNGISLEFDTIRALLEELSRFVDSPALGANLLDVRDRIVLVEMIKQDLVGGTPGQISGEDWVIVFRRIAQTAHWFLKSKQLDQKPVP